MVWTTAQTTSGAGSISSILWLYLAGPRSARKPAPEVGTDLFLPVSNQLFIHETILYPAVLSGNDKLLL